MSDETNEPDGDDTVECVWIPTDDKRWEERDDPEPVSIPGTFSGYVSAPMTGLRGANPDLIRQVLEKIAESLGRPCDVVALAVEQIPINGSTQERIIWRLVPRS